MPVILNERDHEAGLDPKNENTEALQKLNWKANEDRPGFDTVRPN